MNSPFTIYTCDTEDGETVYTGYIDENGHPVERTPHTHPYSYDMYVQWRGLPNKGVNGSIYSDRLLQWDWDKHNELCRKHFGNEGQYWSDRDPEKIQDFLRDWCQDPGLKLHYIMQGCNVSNGFPVWCFLFHSTTDGDWTTADVAKHISKQVLLGLGKKK